MNFQPHLLQPLINDFEQQLNTVLPVSELGLQLPLRVQRLGLIEAERKQVQVSVLRADDIHPAISGNKWFKLKYNILFAKQQGFTRLVSFGGAWSNHLHAMAHVCAAVDMSALGIIRGEELSAQSNSMLMEIAQQGMQLQFVSRSRYRELCGRTGHPAEFGPGDYVIPEGGDNWLGVLGASTMLPGFPIKQQSITHVLTAMGTGCSFAGLRMGVPASVELIGISAVKGQWVHRQMRQRLKPYFPYQANLSNWLISSSHHRGGFGRTDDELIGFCNNFFANNGFRLDHLYTGKAMMALCQMIELGCFTPGSHVLFVHSGGVQGNRGITNNK